ncbi:MAG: protein kinase, partial [Anaerolineales bacterium]
MTILHSGQMLGPYRIAEQIGKGGMAAVYKAYHAAMDRYVAIKILPFQFAHNQEFLLRFQQEVKVIARLEHPHILPVYDSGEHDSTPYLVMRYLDTGTLKERIQARELTLGETDHLITQLADALGYAHSQKVIHRDIKPSNVLINQRGDVFLTDFGIAKLIGATTQFTASGAITGTPAYMSPEQAEGRKLDARSDIYSMGIILYEMVTGRVPYEAETPLAVILKHLQAPLPMPTNVKPNVHPAIERVILKTLAKDREERFDTAADFVAAWKQALQIAKVTPAETAAPLPPPEPVSITMGPETVSMIQPEPAPEMPPPSPPTLQHVTKPKKRAIFWWIGGLLGLVVLLAVCAFAVFQILGKGGTGVADPGDSAPTAPAGEGAADLGDSSPTTPAGEGEWESWVGSNVIFDVQAYDGLIYTGGPGGITIFNSEGEMINHLTVRDGLPDIMVHDLFIDEEGDGSLWVGTPNGLGRFVDDEWFYYGYEDGVDSTVINFITRVDDFLMVGTSYAEDGGGINIFDGQTWSTLQNFDSAPDEPDRFSNSVTTAVVGPDGYLWIGTLNGLGLFDGKTWERFTTADGLPNNEITALMVNMEDHLLVGTTEGAVMLDDEGIVPFPPLEGITIHDMYQDHDEITWFSTGNGLWRFDPKNGNWDFFNPENNTLPVYDTTGIALGDDGALYFGTFGEGLIRYDGKFTILKDYEGVQQSASWWILPTPDNTLWFMEQYGSLIDVFDPETEEWDTFELPICCPIPFAFDDDGLLWGIGDTGLWIIGPDGETNITSRNGLPTDQVFDIAFAPDGDTWIATEEGLALLSEREIVEVLTSEQTGMESNAILNLLIASDGSLWVGTDMGLGRRGPRGKWDHFSIGNPFSGSFYRVQDVAEDNDGNIWVATSGDGVYRFAGGEWEQFLPTDPGVDLLSVDVNTIYSAPDDSLWFGAMGGAVRFDGEEWTAF